MKEIVDKKTYVDLSVIIIWIVAAAAFIILPSLKDSLIRAVLCIPLVLFVPGYVLIASFFPRKDDLNNVERIALSIGLSIAIVSLLGLLLSFTFGIRLITIFASMVIYSIPLIIVAIYRRNKLSKDEMFSVDLHKICRIIVDEIKPKSGADIILTSMLIFTMIMTAGTIYHVITSQKMGERFTEFYILDENGGVHSYDTDLKLGNSTAYLVGISNYEHESINYVLQAVLDGDVLTSKTISIENNDTWKDNITVVSNKKGTDMMLKFQLFKENNFTIPYRSLHLWVSST